LIKEIKPNIFGDAEMKKEPFTLSMIPEASKRRSFVRKTYRSKDVKSRTTKYMENGWRGQR
jgi:hypothetical protein